MEVQSLGLFIKMLGALSLILGILLAINYGVRRWGRSFGANSNPGHEISVLALKEIIPKKYVAVIRVSGRELILGISDASFKLLGEVRQDAKELGRFDGDNKGGEITR